MYLHIWFIVVIATCLSKQQAPVTPQTKIVGGFTCSPVAYPYLASIKTINNAVFCGGSTVNKYWVLTAAHCCQPSREAQLIVYTGLAERKSRIQRSMVRERIMHPNYSLLPLSSDLCLLKLYKPLHQNSRTIFMKLADESFYTKMTTSGVCTQSFTLGFGSQGKIYPNLTEEVVQYNPKLHCVRQKYMPETYCSWNALIDETMMCALGQTHGGEDVCKGDSGGPLICRGVQIGIVSAGRGCGVGTPTYYTRIDIFSDFINNHTNGNTNWFPVSVYLVFGSALTNICMT